MADSPTTAKLATLNQNEPDPESPILNVNEPSIRQTINIHDLPFDILILFWNLAWDKNDGNRPYFPVVVSHVCHIWRQYALDHSSFWSTVDFTTRRLYAEKAQVWLERSKNSPVDITIGWQPFQGSSVPKVKQVLRIVLPHLWHCRKMKVEGVPEKVARIIFDRLRDASVPLLEALKLSTEHSTNWVPRPFNDGNAPSLSELSIEGRFRKYFLERFTNLRRLQIRENAFRTQTHNESVAYIHQILSKLPRLETLIIDNTLYSIEADFEDSQILRITPPPPLVHESLKYLSPRVSYFNRNAIFASLHLPNAQYFPDSRRALNEFTFGLCILGHMERVRPFPRLVSLRLGGSHNVGSNYGPDFSAQNADNLAHLEGALASVPLLESLTFEFVNLENDEKISCLSRVCPKLEWLTFHSCMGCTLKGIMSIVEGRRARKAFEPIRHLTTREWAWGPRMIEDIETRSLLETALKFEAVLPRDSSDNKYLSRFDVVW